MNSASDLERLLKLGICAYRKGEYSQAIATLSRLCKSKDLTYRAKGYVGLVRIYMAQKNWSQAKTLCQKVGASSNPALRQWSQETLEKISEGMKSTTIHTNSMFHYAALNAGTSVETVSEIDKKQPVKQQGEEKQGGEKQRDPNAQETLKWIYADRLSQGRSLRSIKPGQLWLAQIGGAIAFYVLWQTVIHQVAAIANSCLVLLDRYLPFRLRSLPGDWQQMSWPLLIAMGMIAIAAPWLWDLWLRSTAEGLPCPMSFLRTHSSEAAGLINRQCRQCRWPLPTLWKLPTDIPLIFSYGWLPRNARIVISQGLLTRLKEDEIAALVAYEMSHWKRWHWRLLSVTGLILQVLLWFYWQSALWGNRQIGLVKMLAGTTSTLAYSLFWLLRLPIIGMARVRTYYSDRAATVVTGNPNGLTRALAKLSFGLAASVEQQGYTPILIESLTPLLPVSADLARHRLYSQIPLAKLFAWDVQNPLSAWMSCLATHPPLGDRLSRMMVYTQRWRLTCEIHLKSKPQRRGLSAKEWQQLARQGTPYMGLAAGLAIGLLLLGLGAIAAALKWPMLDWMHKDIGLFRCCLLLGTGVGITLRLNRFFPDLSFSVPPSESLDAWVSDHNLLPADSIPTNLSGILLGRPGIANWLGQDLFLKTQFGLMKIHYYSELGPLGNSVSLERTPLSISHTSVQIIGWYRRGNQPWIDIDKIRADNGSLLQAAHPVYSLLLATIASGSGLWLLIRSSPYS